MTSLIAAGGSGRFTSVIPAGPAARSVTTIAFIWDTSLYQSSPAWCSRFMSVLLAPDRGVPDPARPPPHSHARPGTATGYNRVLKILRPDVDARGSVRQ